MTSLLNRHNPACLPQRSRSPFLTQRRLLHHLIVRTMSLFRHAKQGSRYDTVT